MKYGVIKIAVGVFLGLFAAFVAYKSYEYWELTRLAQEYAERQKLEAQQLQNRISKAAKHMIFLTPENLVTFCGSPLRERSSGSGRARYMTYLHADNHRVQFEFFCSERRCSLTEMLRLDEPDHPRDSYESQIKEMPCLLGLADLPY